MAGQSGTARWNPFALPSDTDFRFWLMIAVALGASTLMYQAIVNTIASDGRRPGVASHAGVGAGIAILLAGALVLYCLHPLWQRRRGGWVPLAGPGTSPVLESLRALAREAGLSRPPAFLWNPLNMTRAGLTFGLPRRRVVAITGGLAVAFRADPDLFRAVALHELAHVRNADVDKAYLVVAVWRSFVITAIVPFAVATLRSGGTDVATRALSLAAMTGVIYLLRNATLRAREMLADVRASTWTGFVSTLERLASDPMPTPRGWRRAVAQARAPLRMHPPAAHRRQAVHDTEPLFGISSWTAAAVGFAGSVTLLNVTAIAGQEAAASVFAALVAGILGLAVWRAAFLAQARGDRVRGLARTALAVGAGFALGDTLSLAATVALPPGFFLTGEALLLFDLVWYGLLFAGALLFLLWLATTARSWLPAVAGRQSPRLAYLIALPLTVPALAVGFWLLLAIEPFRSTGGQLPSSALVESLRGVGIDLPPGPYLWAAVALADLVRHVATQPALLVVAQLFWLVPLVPWIWRRRMSAVSSAAWAAMERSAGPAGTAPPDLQVPMAFIAGAGGAAAFWLLSAMIALALSAVSSDALVAWVVNVQLPVAVGAEAVVAAVVAYRAPSLRGVHGLFAGFVFGVVAAPAALAVTALVASPAALWTPGVVPMVFTVLTGVAVLVTIPVVALAGAIGQLARPAASPASARGMAPALAVGGMAAAAMFLTGALFAVGDLSPLRRGDQPQGTSQQYRSVVSRDALQLMDAHTSMRRTCSTSDAPACRRAVAAVLTAANTLSDDLDRMQPPQCLAAFDGDIRRAVALERDGAQRALAGIDNLDSQEIGSAGRTLDQGLTALARAADGLGAC